MLFIFTVHHKGEKVSLCVLVPWELISGLEVPAPVLCQPGPGVLGHGCSGTPHSRQRSVCSPALLLFSSFLSPFGTCFAWSRVTGLHCQPPVCSPSSIEGGGGSVPTLPSNTQQRKQELWNGTPQKGSCHRPACCGAHTVWIAGGTSHFLASPSCTTPSSGAL